MPGRQARELCPQLTFVNGHFSHYRRLGDAAIKVVSDDGPRDHHRLAVARMEPIEDPALGVLVPGIMPLLRPAPASRIWP